MKLSAMVLMFFEMSNSVIYFPKTVHFSLMIRDCVQPRYLLSFCSMIASKQRCLSVPLGVKEAGKKRDTQKKKGEKKGNKFMKSILVYPNLFIRRFSFL